MLQLCCWLPVGVLQIAIIHFSKWLSRGTYIGLLVLKLGQLGHSVTSFWCVDVSNSSWQFNASGELWKKNVKTSEIPLWDINLDPFEKLVPILDEGDHFGVVQPWPVARDVRFPPLEARESWQPPRGNKRFPESERFLSTLQGRKGFHSVPIFLASVGFVATPTVTHLELFRNSMTLLHWGRGWRPSAKYSEFLLWFRGFFNAQTLIDKRINLPEVRLYTSNRLVFPWDHDCTTRKVEQHGPRVKVRWRHTVTWHHGCRIRRAEVNLLLLLLSQYISPPIQTACHLPQREAIHEGFQSCEFERCF